MTITVPSSEARAAVTAPLLLVEEVSHRVANQYAIAIASIGVETSSILDADAQTALRRVTTKLGAFAEARRILQSLRSSDDLNLGDHLHRLCTAMYEATLRDRRVKLTLLEDEIVLAPERCWLVGLIVAELITNAVRHGFGEGGGMVVVDLGRAGAEIICQVADNGGSPPDPPPSRGRQVITGLASEFGGDVSWRFDTTGVTAMLSFPLS
jgi:two-component sensor histidine kinase